MAAYVLKYLKYPQRATGNSIPITRDLQFSDAIQSIRNLKSKIRNREARNTL